ncbi:NBR1-Ig-like domain-containing protein [Janthinobacterium sp. SUN211]|uniref:NBR1-Ig-like domain-containing protein n=1 Tax=Janthinobacterium sp. SUN211 TaxID=3014786 RepID=UPI002713BFC2|nr:NBR1-Ig-like domain-containing protein [Janthinobacterium sp. SUN211]MDO8051427.1 NBR1-Ig-like domain-containing protein [Janthinobacterium sp. SUN211]
MAQITWSNVFISPTSGTVDPSTGTLQVIASGNVIASTGDTVQSVNLYYDNVLVNTQFYPVVIDEKKDMPINVARSPWMTVPVRQGTHSVWLEATTYNGNTLNTATYTINANPVSLVNAARYLGQNVPSTMVAGRTYNVSVTMQNTGTTTWVADPSRPYRLGAQGNAALFGVTRVEVPGTVAPGNSGVFNFTLTAPSSPGSYAVQWKMFQESVEWFGDLTPNISINVVVSQPSATITWPAEGASYPAIGSTASVSFTGSAAPSSGGTLSSVQLRENGVAFASGSANTISGSKDLTIGTHVIELWVADNFGQTISTYRTVNVTLPVPGITWTGVAISPKNGTADPSTGKLKVVASGQVTTTIGDSVQSVNLYDDNVIVASQLFFVNYDDKKNMPINQLREIAMSALLSPGSHSMRLEAATYNGQSYFSIPYAVNIAPPPPINDAKYLAQSIPTTMVAGQTYSASVTLQNTGNTTWIPDPTRPYQLGIKNPGNTTTFGIGRVNVPGAIAPGASAVFNFTLTAPRNAGSYAVQWQMLQENVAWFGDAAPNAAVSVTTAKPVATITSPADGTVYSTSGDTMVVTVKGSASQVGDVAITKLELLDGNTVIDAGDGTVNFNKAITLPLGHHALVLRATNAASLSGDSLPVSVRVVSQAPGGTSAVNITPPHLGNENAGTLPGNLSVGNDGAALYSIELAVPPGTAGMQPALSLSYSSNGSNGMVGLGWSLGGLSTIHRCPKTVGQDGVAGRISFDGADRLCLDGQRLLRADGGNPGASPSAQDSAYWASGAQYRTEIEGFSRVTRIAAGFKVEDKNGRIRYYGVNANSAIAAQGRGDGQALLWALSRVEDRSGNYFTVSYEVDASTGEYTPAQIRYGGNTNAGSSPDLTVRFSYTSRNDAQVQYMGGSRNDLRKLLSHVQTYINTAADGSGGTLVRDYALGYTNSAGSGRSLVSWVQVSAFNALTGIAEPMPRTDFSYGDGGRPKLVQKNSFEFNVMADGENIPIKTYTGDFHGLGETSIFVPWQVCMPAMPNCNLRYFNGKLAGRSNSISGWDATLDMSRLTGKYDQILTGDFNGDGRDDIVLLDSGGRSWAYCLALPAGPYNPLFAACQTGGALPPMRDFNRDGDLPTLASVDNDGRSQLMYFDAANQAHICSYNGTVSCRTLPTTTPGGVVTTGFMPIELSKQGQSDFYMINNPDLQGGVISYSSNVTVCRRSKDSFLCDLLSSNGIGMSGAGAGDLNGDGLTDFFYSDNGGNKLCLSSETGVNCRPMTSRGVALPDMGSIGFDYFFAGVADMLGDGVNRYWGYIGNTSVPNALCRLADGSEKCQEVDVSGIPAETLAIIRTGSGSRSRPFTIDGSGVPAALNCSEVPNFKDSSYRQSCWITSLVMPASQDRLVSVTNGIGHSAEIDYTRGDDSSVYSRFATVVGTERRPVYPQKSTVPGVMAKQLRQANGQGGWITSNMNYAGAMYDAGGRGSLGFALMRTTDATTGIAEETIFSQTFPLVGMVEASRRFNSRCTLESVTNQLQQQSQSMGSGAVSYFPYISGTGVKRSDLDCTALGTVTVTNQYNDGWGNLTSRNTVTEGGGRNFVQTDTTTYFTAPGWVHLSGLPLSMAIARTDGASLTRSTSYTYNSTTGLRETETVEPNNLALAVLTTYDRSANQFGQVNKITQSWTNPACAAAGWPEAGCISAQSRTVSDTTYDAKGRFPISVKNAMGHATSQAFDDATGAPTRRTDANNLTTNWTVDRFGRVMVELRPDGNEMRNYLKRCAGDCAFHATTVQIKEAFHGNDRIAVPQVVYRDSAGHVERSKTWGFDGTPVVVDQRYDDRGRLVETDQPRFDGAAAYLETRWGYDDLNRTISTSLPDDAGTVRTTSTTYRGLEIEHKNPAGQVRTENHDVLGQLRQVLDSGSPRGTTSFTYEPFGGLQTTLDPNGNRITVNYDTWGRKIGLRDPDLGFIEYAVNPLGQVYRQISPEQRAKGTRTWMAYDLLGRMTARYESDLESHWVHDTAAKGVGQLARAYTGQTATPDYIRTHSYDILGRPALTTQKLYDGLYSATPTYDSWGRLVKQTYKRGNDTAKDFSFAFNGYGYPSRIERGPLVLWQATQQDAAGRARKVLLGNGLIQNRDFNTYSGRLIHGGVSTASSAMRLQEDYVYDVLGNVKNRSQYWDSNGFQESFDYDTLNRLKSSQVLGKTARLFTYDAAGNITSKTGVGTYAYRAQGETAVQPHAVQTISGIPGIYSYDTNGNLLNGGGRTITWTSFDMPQTIKKDAITATFNYGPEHQRVGQLRRGNQAGGTDERVIYAGAQEVESGVNGGMKVKTYWPNGIGVEIDQGGTTQLHWTHVDRLGSPVAMTGEDGTIRTDGRLEYDAWGKRRSVADNDNTDDSIDGKIDNRGFTGHEMLDQLDLVHMNGRVYDPLTAKFLSGDPLVSDPKNGQNYNRYSYVSNNPINLTDPTGFLETPLGTAIPGGSPPAGYSCEGNCSAVGSGRGDKNGNSGDKESKAATGGGAAAGRVETAKKGSANNTVRDAMLSSPNPAVAQGAACVGHEGACAGGLGSLLGGGWLGTTKVGQVVLGLFGFGSQVQNMADGIPPTVIPSVIVAGSKAEAAALRAADAAAQGELSFGRKLDFLFNRGIDQSNAYNAARAAGNAGRIGIADNPLNRAEVTRLFNNAYRDSSTIVPSSVPGRTMHEFFLPGVTSTGSKIQFVEEEGRVITIISK